MRVVVVWLLRPAHMHQEYALDTLHILHKLEAFDGFDMKINALYLLAVTRII